jgi:two-component system, LytTR family, sensor kinase
VMVAIINFFSAATFAYGSIFLFSRIGFAPPNRRRLILSVLAFAIGVGVIKHMARMYVFYMPLLARHSDNVPSLLAYWKVPYVTGSIVYTISQASLLLVFYFFSLWARQQSLMEKARREKVEAELELLKSQVEPHFIFNTLNNIYYLAQKSHPKTGEMIYRLAQLLSFMLYDSRKSLIPVQKEMDYIRDYVNLERIRYGENLDIAFNEFGKWQDHLVPPLLLLPLVENAFKHGIAPVGAGWIRVDISKRGSNLVCKVENSMPASSGVHSPKSEASGLGLTNLKSRLEALFPDQHDLKTLVGKESFLAVMTIPVA